MPFLKKHYEKILLSAVLLGLAVAAAALPLQVSRVRQFLDDTVSSVARTPPKPFKPLDEYITTNKAVLARFASPPEFNFSAPHNLFNPVIWKKRPNGTLQKISSPSEMGAGALVVSKIDELKLTIEFDKAESVGGSGENFRYHFTVIRDTDSTPKKTQTATLNVPNTLFTLIRADGPPGDPTALHLNLKEEKQEIVVTKEKPYVRVIGYTADLKHSQDNHPFSRKREKESLTLKGDSEKYKIVAITSNEVVVSAESTQKRTTISLNAPAQ